jgi:hypothetical protein
MPVVGSTPRSFQNRTRELAMAPANVGSFAKNCKKALLQK